MLEDDAPENDRSFNALALDTFRFQYQYNKAYQQWCLHLGINEAQSISRWQDIPAVPTSAFKDAGLKLNCFSENCLETIV